MAVAMDVAQKIDIYAAKLSDPKSGECLMGIHHHTHTNMRIRCEDQGEHCDRS